MLPFFWSISYREQYGSGEIKELQEMDQLPRRLCHLEWLLSKAYTFRDLATMAPRDQL